MLTLSLTILLADGATVLSGQRSRAELHDQFSDGKGCYCLHLHALDTAVMVKEPGLQVEWLKPRA
eukprot:3066309-Amphidinium_carterae.1